MTDAIVLPAFLYETYFLAKSIKRYESWPSKQSYDGQFVRVIMCSNIRTYGTDCISKHHARFIYRCSNSSSVRNKKRNNPKFETRMMLAAHPSLHWPIPLYYIIITTLRSNAPSSFAVLVAYTFRGTTTNIVCGHLGICSYGQIWPNYSKLVGRQASISS